MESAREKFKKETGEDPFFYSFIGQKLFSTKYISWLEEKAVCNCLLYTDPEKSCEALKDHKYETETGKQASSMGQNLRGLAARVEAE